MKKLIFYLLISILFKQAVYSQTSFTENYPLKVGNVFVFKEIFSYPLPPTYIVSYHKSRVLRDTIMNSRKYFFIPDYSDHGSVYLRLDSLTGNLFKWDSSNSCTQYGYEKLLDSLSSELSDTTFGCGASGYQCYDTNAVQIFNLSRISKKFRMFFGIGSHTTSYSRTYVKGIGLVYTRWQSTFGSGTTFTELTLLGCLINGILYGDTAVPVSVHKISSELPSVFSLFQNYPNPFNPVTKINFDLPKNSKVKLVVYDLLGREVRTLVESELLTGKYEFEFDGGDLVSGVYFYRIVAGDFVQTKRMVLIK